MADPIGEIHYRGELHVRPYRRGTYLGDEYLEEAIERALGARYRFGSGWDGFAIVSIALYDEPAPDGEQQSG